MKIRSVRANHRKKAFEVRLSRGWLPFPYARAKPAPTKDDRVAEVSVDAELGGEALTYRLESGAEGSLHVDAVLEYNEDPGHMADLLAHELAVAARTRIDGAALSRREICRRLNTSASQLYRLLDEANGSSSMRQIVALLHVLGCEVSLRVTDRADAKAARRTR